MKRDMIKSIMTSYFHNRIYGRNCTRSARKEGNNTNYVPESLNNYHNIGLNRNGLGPGEVYKVLSKLSLKKLRQIFLDTL